MISNKIKDLDSILKEALLVSNPKANSLISEITDDTELFELGIDSMGMFEMVGFIEEELDILLPNEILFSVTTLGDVKKVIEGEISG